MATVTVHCPRFQSARVYRHGQNPKGRELHFPVPHSPWSGGGRYLGFCRK